MPEVMRVVGLDHHRSPIELRERMAIGPGDLEPLLADLSEVAGVDEMVAVSTCNRTEFYLAGAIDDQTLLAAVAERQGVELSSLTEHCYHHAGREAVRHLFRVVSSLESMVVGEYQIMHQVRFAYEQARLRQRTGGVLNPLFQRALAVGKEVRNDTGIGKHKLSMASIAVDLARHIHGDLTKRSLLVVGAGEMAELAVRHFVDHGVTRLSVINRTRERALAIAPDDLPGAEVAVRHWAELAEALGSHDVVVASTAAPHPVITQELVRKATARRREPLMFIDLAVPRDVDPAVGELDEAFLYNVDHLEQVVVANRQLREDEVDGAVRLVDQRVEEAINATDRHTSKLRGAVAGFFDQVVDEECERLARKLGVPVGEEDQLRYGLKRVGNKLQHRIQRFLAERNDDPEAVALVRDLLGL